MSDETEARALIDEFLSFSQYLRQPPANQVRQKREVSVRMILAVADALATQPPAAQPVDAVRDGLDRACERSWDATHRTLWRHASEEKRAEWAIGINAALAASPTPPADASAQAGAVADMREIDRLAQFLHDEGGFGDAMTDRTWPEHDADTGQRGDGWVKILPSDVVAHFRDVARRWLLPRTLPLTPDGGGEA